eukprot:TRINITY_DN13930_c0_g1_i1.p3 TRINITY_DN13930_c0_g1~~TRINITY_DN13930_c0_g1_i1.p3  ORF type:complete len:120 (+),score=1.48 TRINITY_DN13930_c0_g1_i1:82-441(+)
MCPPCRRCRCAHLRLPPPTLWADHCISQRSRCLHLRHSVTDGESDACSYIPYCFANTVSDVSNCGTYCIANSEPECIPNCATHRKSDDLTFAVTNVTHCKSNCWSNWFPYAQPLGESIR